MSVSADSVPRPKTIPHSPPAASADCETKSRMTRMPRAMLVSCEAAVARMCRHPGRALQAKTLLQNLLMPIVFVLIWSTGFVVARYGMPHAPPLGFLAWRYALSIAAFALWIAWSRPAWPRSGAQWLHLAVTGALMHGGYLGGVWAAVKADISAGTVALIVGLQPLLTAVWVSASGAEHRVSARQWLGLALGLAGLLLVVSRKLGVGEVTAANLA